MYRNVEPLYVNGAFFFSMRLVEKVPRILTLTFMPVQGPKSIIALCTGRKNGNFLDNK